MSLNEPSNKIFLSVADGMITQSYGVTEHTPKAEKRVRKDGSISWELRFRSVTAMIRAIYTRENEFNGKKIKKWVLELEDKGEHYQLEMLYNSRYAKSMLYALPNCNLNHPITFNPWTKTIDGKTKMAMYLNQGGSKDSVQWFFTRENPKGMPEMKQVQFQGETKWDDHEQMLFLSNYVDEHIKPKLSAAPAPEPTNAIEGTEEEDDLPF